MTRIYAPDFCLVPKIAEIGSLNGGKIRPKTGAEKFGLKYFGVTD